MKRLGLFISIAVILLSSITSALSVTSRVSAFDCSEAGIEARNQFQSDNNIPFHDPCEGSGTCSAGGSAGGSAPTQLQGGTNAEKSWNYFIARGLTPVAAAGAMGNIEQESGFSASAVESNGIGLGIIQWSFDRRTKLEAAAAAAGVNLSDNDSALLFQLNYLWDGEYGKTTWSDVVNKETKIEGDTTVNSMSAEANVGNGSTLYFHAAVERSADTPSMLQHRIDNAKGFLEQFGGGGAAGNNCGGSSGSMTLEQGTQLMQDYITGTEAETLVPEQIPYCTSNQGWKANCVTFSMYFLRKFTTLNVVSADGKNIVSRNKAANPGVESGSTPKPMSVFSYSGGDASEQYGHTGVILNVDTTKGTMIIAEANCDAAGPKEVSHDPYNPFVVREVPISGTHPANVEYLYTDGKRK